MKYKITIIKILIVVFFFEITDAILHVRCMVSTIYKDLYHCKSMDPNQAVPLMAGRAFSYLRIFCANLLFLCSTLPNRFLKNFPWTDFQRIFSYNSLILSYIIDIRLKTLHFLFSLSNFHHKHNCFLAILITIFSN